MRNYLQRAHERKRIFHDSENAFTRIVNKFSARWWNLFTQSTRNPTSLGGSALAGAFTGFNDVFSESFQRAIRIEGSFIAINLSPGRTLISSSWKTLSFTFHPKHFKDKNFTLECCSGKCEKRKIRFRQKRNFKTP